MWGAVAFFFGHKALGPGVWGGVLVSPAIGLLVGFLSWPVRQSPPKAKAFISLALVYLSAILFGLAAGLGTMIIRFGPHGIHWSVMAEMVFIVLWGTTMTGFFILFWPMSYFNLWLVARASDEN